MISHRHVGSVWRQFYYSQALWGVAGHPWKYLPQCNREKKVTPISLCARRPWKRAPTQHTALACWASKLKNLHTNLQTWSWEAHQWIQITQACPRVDAGGHGVSRNLFHSSSIVSMINTSIDFEVRHHSGQIRVRVLLFHTVAYWLPRIKQILW